MTTTEIDTMNKRSSKSQPVAAEAPRTAVVTLTIGGIVYRGEGRTRDEALANMQVVKE